MTCSLHQAPFSSVAIRNSHVGGWTAYGGEEVVCGWLKDKYGLSWQIVPEVVTELLAGADRAKANRVMAAVMKMKKLDLAQLERA